MNNLKTLFLCDSYLNFICFIRMGYNINNLFRYLRKSFIRILEIIVTLFFQHKSCPSLSITVINIKSF